VVAARSAVAIDATAATVDATASAAVVGLGVARRRRGQRAGGSSFTLRRGTTELGTRCGKHARRLGTHAEDASAAGGQDLEIEVIKPYAEVLPRQSQGLLD
jgi:hypothetical protein